MPICALNFSHTPTHKHKTDRRLFNPPCINNPISPLQERKQARCGGIMHEILGSVGLIWICQQNLYLMYARKCIPVDLSANTLKSLDDATGEWIACVKWVICGFYSNKPSAIFFVLHFCDWSVADEALLCQIMGRWKRC